MGRPRGGGGGGGKGKGPPGANLFIACKGGTFQGLSDESLRMVNRNRGAGTRVLIDELLGDRRPAGYAYEPRSHYAVAAAVAQKRADWGVTIETVAEQAGLRFQPLRAESYDFAVPAARWDVPAVATLRRLLEPGSALRAELAQHGFRDGDGPG